MSDSQRVPDGSAGARERAGATEDYGGVPISEQELAEVWTTGDGDSDPAPDAASASASDPDSASASASDSGSASDGADAAGAGPTRPEVPADDPAPAEPS